MTHFSFNNGIVFVLGGFHGMQAPGKAPTVMAGFAPNQPHGPYEFTSQHAQV